MNLRDLRAGLAMLQLHRARAEAKRHTLELAAWDALIGAAQAVIACHEAPPVHAPGLVRTMRRPEYGPTRYEPMPTQHAGRFGNTVLTAL